MYNVSQNSAIKEKCLSNYDTITSLYPFQIVDKRGKKHGPITYSILNTILDQLFEATDKKIVCLGGRIELFFEDPFESPDPIFLKDKVFTEFFLPDNIDQYRYIYIALTASWVYKKFAYEKEKTKGEFKDPLSRYVCNGRCENGHCMSILIDQQEKTIEYFDCDSAFSPWYKSINDFLRDYFKNTVPFQFHQFHVLEKFDLNPDGVMNIVEQPLCALYSSLYIWKRTILGQPRKELLKWWHKLDYQQSIDDLCKWEKFLDKHWKRLIPKEKQIIPLFEKCWNHEVEHGRKPEKELHFIGVWLFYNFDYAVDLMKEKLENY